MKFLYTILLIFCLTVSAFAQNQYAKLTDTAGLRIIEQSKVRFPKFYQAFKQLKSKDSLIKDISFIMEPGVGPAFASPKGIITFNLEYLIKPKPNFDDDRFLVIMYHEIGHLHYFTNVKQVNWNSENSEKAAFEYSLLKTKELAQKNDCLPLMAGVKFMKLRSEGSNLQDPHVRALKRMIKEPLYADYVKYLNDHCKKL